MKEKRLCEIKLYKSNSMSPAWPAHERKTGRRMGMAIAVRGYADASSNPCATAHCGAREHAIPF